MQAQTTINSCKFTKSLVEPYETLKAEKYEKHKLDLSEVYLYKIT